MTKVNFTNELLKSIQKTPSEFARDWGYSRQQVYRWTSGKNSPALVTVAKWIAAYGLTREFLQEFLIHDGDLKEVASNAIGGTSNEQDDKEENQETSLGSSFLTERAGSKLKDIL